MPTGILSHAAQHIACDLIRCTHARQAQVAVLQRLQQAGVRAVYLTLEGDALHWEYDSAHLCEEVLETLERGLHGMPVSLNSAPLTAFPHVAKALSTSTAVFFDLTVADIAQATHDQIPANMDELARVVDIRRGVLGPVVLEGRTLGVLWLWAENLSPDDLPAAGFLGQLLGAALTCPAALPPGEPAADDRETLLALQAVLASLTLDRPLEQSLSAVSEAIPRLIPNVVSPIFAFRGWERDEWVWKPLLPEWAKAPLQERFDTAEEWPAVPVEQSRFWETLARGEPVFTDDGGEFVEHVVSPDDVRDIQRAAGIRSLAVFPLMVGEEVLGLMVAGTREDGFTDGQTSLMAACAAQIAATVNNVQTYRKQLRRLEQIGTLVAAAGEILLPKTAPQRNQAIVSLAVRLLDADAAALYGPGTGGQEAACFASHGLSPHYVRRVFETYPDIPGTRVQTTLLPLRVGDLTTDAESDRVRQMALGEGLRSMLVLPMVVGKNLRGALTVYRKQPVPFSDETVLMGQAYASLCALSRENLSLILALERQLHTAEVLRQVLQELIAQGNLEQVGSTIIRHARRISKSDGGIIYVWSPEKNALMTLSTIRGGKTFKERTLKPNEGVAGAAFAEDKPVAVDDYEAWDRKSLQGPRKPLGPAAAVPIRFEGKPIGALCVVRDVLKPPYRDDELEVLEVLAEETAAAVVLAQRAMEGE